MSCGGIGGRSRSYVELYRGVGESLEKSGDAASAAGDSPCLAAEAFASKAKIRLRQWMEERAGASMLFFVVPLAVSVLFVLLLVLTRAWTLMPPAERPALAPPSQPSPQQAAPTQPPEPTTPAKG